VSSLTGWRVCLLYSTLYWSLRYLTLSGVYFTRPPLEFSLLDPLLKSSSFDPLWSLLYSTFSEILFAGPSTGVFFIWPSLESTLHDLLWSFLCSTLYWSLLHLTLSGVYFTRPSLKFSLLDPLLESSSLKLCQSVIRSVGLVVMWANACLCPLGVKEGIDSVRTNRKQDPSTDVSR
jgi:hypothetical protein